jgi:hypothetical protein
VAATVLNMLWASLSVVGVAWVAWHLLEAQEVLALLNLIPPSFLWLPVFGMMIGLSVLAIILWRRGWMRLNTLEVHI